MFIFRGIWNGMKWLAGLVLPFLAKASHVRALGPQFRWVIHFAIVIGILAGLGFLNYALDVGKLLDTPHPLLRRVWLPLLFLLVYALAWVGWWLWTLLGAEEESSAHPDIDAAWDQATAALRNAGIDVTEVPLFLVLGNPAGSTALLFRNAQLDLVVDQAGPGSSSPAKVLPSWPARR